MPPGAISMDDVDIDQISIDYVLNCAKKGETLISQKLLDFFMTALTILQWEDLVGRIVNGKTNDNGTMEEFFLVTKPESSGSAPTRAPPPVPATMPSPIVMSFSKSQSVHSQSFHSQEDQELTVDDIEDFEDEDEEEDEVTSLRLSRRQSNNATDISLRLPPFTTGITDDDLRETAYEILIASAGATGGLIVPSKEKKKEKKSKLMRKLGRSKSESVSSQVQRAPGLVGLLETMRAQLEITESMDIRTRQGLLNALVGKVGKRMDNLLIPLELLSCVSRTEFSDKKAYLRWQKRQLNMLEEGLINHSVVGFGEMGRKLNELRNIMRQIEESESLSPSAAEIQRTECLRSLREIATSLAERPARGDLTGEVCHWADGYHLNVRLYEKMLGGVFDVLDEGKLTEEVEEILELLKATWRILGITETIHDTCYAWVLFRQRWADKILTDYHLNFSEGPEMMAEIVTVAMLTRRILMEENENQVTGTADRDQIDHYITSSVKSAFSRITHAAETKAETVHQHVLAFLAEEAMKLLKKDTTMFLPILSKWHSQAAIVSASLLHKLYGHKLRPFLDRAEHLTEDVVCVFPAADNLEHYIMSVMSSVVGDGGVEDICRQKITPYQVENISGTLVLRWVNAQLDRISGWVKRAIQQEAWEPISPQQRHGSSIVEVYRIIEETVDQFFGLKVPMRVGELNSLYRGLDNAFQAYTNYVTEHLVNKDDLIPPVPVLTRYKKEMGIKAFVKKDVAEIRIMDDKKSSEINALTSPKLCVQLNTLYYAITQLNKLEDSIGQRWAKKKSETFNARRSLGEKSKSFASSQNNAFDGSRKEINSAIDRICEFTGIKVVFWDLREPFIDNLYKHSVSHARLDTITEALDVVLNQLCGVIVDPLRDRVVTGLLQASLDGLLRVILDGGPSRLFYPSDSKLLEEDLEILKEFFISGGDGLPRGTVENLVARVRPVINLLSYETRVLIDDLKEMTHGGRSKLGADSKTLLRILCHRSDSEASQFLKKQFKIPKSAA
uniref:Protein unc-13 homolog n=1 Tax=Ananas comosus var. bracteatus TaxID=296719 RepID=A0A6V7Q6W9_ANACO|nr:unnamed protein product [Ananas comosus var. bracteatus]